jgi:2-keto-4-pentenoate hydratase/2-oxohepta-3-ene-1,7-dioic acid hydratase in catechol pathway
MRFSIAEVDLVPQPPRDAAPGDLIATGTRRGSTALGPERHLGRATSSLVWIEQIGELITTIA